MTELPAERILKEVATPGQACREVVLEECRTALKWGQKCEEKWGAKVRQRIRDKRNKTD